MRKQCIVCGADFEARADAKYHSPKCEYAANAEKKRQRCRDWRAKHPDKQRESCMKWIANNQEKHRSAAKNRQDRFHERHPEARARYARSARERNPDLDREYKATLVAALELTRMLKIYGLAALGPEFVESPLSTRILRQRQHTRSWRERNKAKRAEYEHRRKAEFPGADAEACRRHQAKRSAALMFIRELQSKGLEALL